MPDTQSPQEYFRLLLLTVVEGAFTAAGYTLDERPLRWANGRFAFRKPLGEQLTGFIEFQHLHYVEGGASRFNVTLTRTDESQPGVLSDHPQSVQRTLAALVVDDFGVAILPSADHWWTFHNTDELGKALAEAGHLIVGYGLPWLAGDLTPPLG